MKLAIVGTHTIDETHENYELMKRALFEVIDIYKVTEITSGRAAGIDTFAEILAMEYEIPMKLFPADWKKYGRAAGPIRNTDIVDRCDILVAFPDEPSIGTRDSMKKAGKQGKLHHTFWWEKLNNDD